MAPVPCKLQAPGGLDIAHQLKWQWNIKENRFRDEAEVVNILAQAIEVGVGVESRMATGPRGYREDWSLCRSTLNTSPQNGFHDDLASEMLVALMEPESVNLKEGRFLVRVARSQDAFAEDRVAVRTGHQRTSREEP